MKTCVQSKTNLVLVLGLILEFLQKLDVTKLPEPIASWVPLIIVVLGLLARNIKSNIKFGK